MKYISAGFFIIVFVSVILVFTVKMVTTLMALASGESWILDAVIAFISGWVIASMIAYHIEKTYKY